MSDREPVYSLSISGRIVLDMHSLNNEGGEGNQIATRMVNVVYKDRRDGEYNLATVNAVSGDMLKHIQAEHLYFLARGMGLPLCAGCRKFSASRVLDDPGFLSEVVGRRREKKWEFSDRSVIDELLRRCAIDDLAGVLIAPERERAIEGAGGEAGEGEGQQRRGRASARSIPRKSVAEFGWVVGLPGRALTDSYFHVRYAAERGLVAEGERVEQPIFHRPASSGAYAVVANFEVARIGYNDISQTYAIDEGERQQRYRALMESVLYTFIEPNGAMRSTQNPHIVEFEGAITATSDVMPAPTLSPLDDDYRSQLGQVVAALNRLKPGAIAAYHFGSMGQFADVMEELIEVTKPYRVPDFGAFE